jgi:hypothetical protein
MNLCMYGGFVSRNQLLLHTALEVVFIKLIYFFQRLCNTKVRLFVDQYGKIMLSLCMWIWLKGVHKGSDNVGVATLALG